MEFSREHPSAKYRGLLEMYREMHLTGEKYLGISAKETFDGRSLVPQVGRIKRLIEATGAATILDYGSGKGSLYDARRLNLGERGEWDGVVDYWGIDEVRCFDPAYPPFSELPTQRFDGVISTDVLEHCPEEDVGWIVDEMFSFADKFVFATIACFAAHKRLPNGENAHCTIRPPEWWAERFRSAAAKRAGVVWEIWIQTLDPQDKLHRHEQRFGSEPTAEHR
jgi:hypothetical protein